MEVVTDFDQLQSKLDEAGWKLKRADLGISGQTDVWIGTRAGRDDALPDKNSASRACDMDLETEVIRLRSLVEGYERGKFIRFMKWLNSSNQETKSKMADHNDAGERLIS